MTIQIAVTTLVQNILEQTEQIAIEAIRDAFFMRPVSAQEGSRSKRTSGKRRTRAQVDEYAARLFQEIMAKPGAFMKELAPKLGVPARELNLPARKLVAERKIKTTGARNETRYYPLGKMAA